jgi:glycolate oxidase iron-sulfur subunit
MEVFLERKIDAIVVNVAGCGSTLKEYDHVLGHAHGDGKAIQFARRVRDVSEFLMELRPMKPVHPLPLQATYHDACHLCHAQQIRQQPRELLQMIPGLELVPLKESEICCGAAGSYNLTEPDMALRLGERKVRNILDTGAEVVFTANAGCLLQIARHLKERGSRKRVAHPVEALWASYSRGTL